MQTCKFDASNYNCSSVSFRLDECLGTFTEVFLLQEMITATFNSYSAENARLLNSMLTLLLHTCAKLNEFTKKPDFVTKKITTMWTKLDKFLLEDWFTCYFTQIFGDPGIYLKQFKNVNKDLKVTRWKMLASQRELSSTSLPLNKHSCMLFCHIQSIVLLMPHN